MNFNVLKADERIMLALRQLYSSYGYLPYKVSKFEEYDLYVQNKSFLTSEQILTFSDLGGKLMALKPDVTLSIIKNTKDDGAPRKLYYNENVYRVPRNAYGFREIMQTGLECIGQIDACAMCEVLTLAAKSLAAISERYVLDVSDMGIISGILAQVESGGQTAILQAFSEKNRGGLDAACQSWQVQPGTAALLDELLQLSGPLAQTLPKLAALPLPESCRPVVAALEQISEVLAGQGIGNVNLDFSVVNDMDYYNGLIFKGFVDGIPAGVLSGGRYDSLMAKMGKRSGAIGFAVYLDQLERFQQTASAFDVDVLVLYDEKTDAQALFRKADSCRAAGKTARVGQSADGVCCREVADLRGEGVR